LRGAIDLDLFTAIGQGAATAEAIAQRCSADLRAVRILCDYLVVLGFLAKSDQSYSLTPTAAVFLDRSSPHYLGSTARFVTGPHLLDAFRDVEQLVRRGSTLLAGSGTVEPEYEGWVEFARSMAPMMRPVADFIGGLVAERTSGPLRVLDIAAGHGLFGVAVARRNPHATIVALDWANVLAVAERRGRITEAQSVRFSRLLGALPIDVDDDPATLQELVHTARHHGLSAYDASYLLLALRLGAPLATLDGRLRDAAKTAGVGLVP